MKPVSPTSYSHISSDNFTQGGYGIGSLTVNTLSGWRYMYATSVPLAVIMGIGMWWLPASPRWLLLRVIQGKGNVENQKEAAIKSLCRLRGPAFVDSAAEQVNEILAELSFVGEDKEATFGELFQGKCKKALIIGGGLVLFQQVGTVKLNHRVYFRRVITNVSFVKWQITGQPSVLYYAPSILQVFFFFFK